jgi:hypothetical protein
MATAMKISPSVIAAIEMSLVYSHLPSCAVYQWPAPYEKTARAPMTTVHRMA